MKTIKTHYYLLPDGTKVDNMKDGCEYLNISSEKFRAKVRGLEIKRININEAKATNNEKQD